MIILVYIIIVSIVSVIIVFGGGKEFEIVEFGVGGVVNCFLGIILVWL